MSGIGNLLQLKVRACQVHLTINALKHSNYDLALVSNTHLVNQPPAIPYYANIQSESSVSSYLFTICSPTQLLCTLA